MCSSIRLLLFLLISAVQFAMPISASAKICEYGYIDKTGKIIFRGMLDYYGPFTQFDDSIDFHEGFAVSTNARESNYIDTAGKIRLGPFSGASRFSEGLACVRQNNDDLIINANGDIVFRLKAADDLSVCVPKVFKEGLLAVKHGRLIGFIDRKGQWAVSPQFCRSSPFSEGLAAVAKEYKADDGQIRKLFAYINRKGDFVIKAQYSHALPFSGGLAQVKTRVAADSDLTDFIHKSGSLAFRVRPCFDSSFSEGLLLLLGTDAYLDAKGKVAVKLDSGQRGLPFHEGLAAVCSSSPAKPQGAVTINGCGFINKSGAWVIPLNKEIVTALSFSEGLAPVQIRNSDSAEARWGFMDKSGKLVIPPVYKEVRPFSEGRAAVVF